MNRRLLSVLTATGLTAGLLAMTAPASAWTAVQVPGSYGSFGATVTDFWGSHWVSARAMKFTPPDGALLDVTANSGPYLSSLSIWCTTGPSSPTRQGTNPTNGDITLVCPNGGLLFNAGGAIQAQ